MKSMLKLTLAAALTCALPAWACTPEEATAKREQLAQQVAKLTEQNPAKAKEINDELQKMDLGTAAKDLPDKCQLIDQRLKELGSAEKKAES
jgi:outer membrane murein-binding lipoprotein Lpp